MSSFLSIIIWVLIISAVSGILKKKNNGADTKDQNPYTKNGIPGPAPDFRNGRNTGQAGGNVSVYPSNGHPAQPSAAAGTGGPARPGFTGANPEKQKHSASKAESRPPVNQENMSTTDYLRQKANLDEADHNEDKRLGEIRASRERGGLQGAQRLLEGDSIPPDMRVINCSYCGAENLVPQGSRQKYTCYFCREELS